MKLSELIQSLQDAQAELGDLPVYWDGRWPHWVDEVKVELGATSRGREWVARCARLRIEGKQ